MAKQQDTPVATRKGGATPKPRAAKNSEADLRRLELAQAQRDFHHGAFWKAQLHFSWMVAAITTAVGYLAVAEVFDPVSRYWLMTFGCLLGLACSLSAVKVLRREGEFLHRTAIIFSRLHDLVLAESPAEKISYQRGRANKPVLSLVLFRTNGIRDTLQVLFLLAAVAFGVAAALIVAAGPAPV